NRWRDAFLQPDPLLPPELRPRWQQRLDGPIRALSTGLLTSVASWLGSIMLTAYYFNLITPVSLLANIVVVPLSSAALMCNLGSLLCGAWLPFASELFNHAGWFFMIAMVRVSHWCADLPFGFFYVPAPPIWLCLVWFAALLPLLSGWALTRERRRWSLPAYAIVAIGVSAWWWTGRSEIRLDVLPLSGGHAVWMNGPQHGDQLLVDCGDSRSVEFVTIPFLRSRGVNRLEQFLLTHGDVRHIGGATNLFEAVNPGTTYKSHLRFRSTVYRSLEQSSRPFVPIASGDHLGRWTVLHPAPTDQFTQADDGTVVLSADLHGTRVLLLSDLGRPGQESLLKRHPELRADIVITGLPAVGEPLNDALIEQLHPRLIVVADTELPATQRASPQLRERLARHKIPILYGRDSGAVTLKLKPENELQVIPLVPHGNAQDWAARQ
ncbi:MAG: ComEC/Rec2 family competence protein, partial [Opitutaceae bacterium]|nr:ComEC/Rec2 family competence protein [Verrucomicrobiales bacterium]